MSIFYLHIPKTGGQTLAARLASAFPAGQSSIMGELCSPDGQKQLLELLEKNQFVERHLQGAVLKDVSGIDILTTVREPVKQIVSTYMHIVREPGNYLYRAAKMLAPEEFFVKFGDILSNNQSKYIVAPFFERERRSVYDFWRYYTEKIFIALDKVRWVAPTENIDEFTMLWSIENHRRIPNETVRKNTARKEGNYRSLMEIVRNLPELYAVDYMLWEQARKRFADYKESVLDKAIPFGEPDNTTRAFFRNGEGIWLRKGWYEPQAGGEYGSVWWAGPENYSQVYYKRKREHRFLQFSVSVVCGVSHGNIRAAGPDKNLHLQAARLNQGRHWDFSIDLGSMPDEGYFWLWVPEVQAPIMQSKTDEDISRRSFATHGWSFAARAASPLPQVGSPATKALSPAA